MGKRFLLILLLVVGPAVGIAKAEDALGARWLFKTCSEFVSNLDNGQSNNQDVNEVLSLAYCTAYMASFSQYTQVVRLLIEKGQLTGEAADWFYCAPRLSPADYAEVFVRYAREHPEELDQPPHFVLWGAFREAWPCD